jgi:hypothetical protein
MPPPSLASPTPSPPIYGAIDLMSPTWKAVIGVILIFILGWFGGALSTLVIVKHKAMMVQRNPEALAIVLERQTTRNLGLDADQKSHLHSIFLDNLRQRMELQRQIQPQVKTINGQTLQQIDTVLKPDQQQKFHDNLVLFKDRFGRNPFNVGSDDGAAKTTMPDAMSAGSTDPTTNAGTYSK